MTNAGELKFWQLQNSPEKRGKRLVLWPRKSYLALNVGGVEESGNNFALFLFFNTLGVLKSVRVYLFATFLFG